MQVWPKDDGLDPGIQVEQRVAIEIVTLLSTTVGEEARPHVEWINEFPRIVAFQFVFLSLCCRLFVPNASWQCPTPTIPRPTTPTGTVDDDEWWREPTRE